MIRFKQTKKFSKPSLEKLLNSYAEETGMIDESTVKELLKSDSKDKLTEHLVEWDKLVDNAQDDEALKKADEIRKMIRNFSKVKLRRFSDDKTENILGKHLTWDLQEISWDSGKYSYEDIDKFADKVDSSKVDLTELKDLVKMCKGSEGPEFDKLAEKIRKFITSNKLKKFSDDKMLFVEYVDEDGDTTHQVMKKSEFEQVKDEAKINRSSGAKLKILTEEVYDKTNPKHKKYKDHPVTETKEFAETREQVPQYIADEVDKNGVIVKYKDSWRIVSKKQKPYEFWDAHYDTKEDAEAALAAYHANQK